MLFASAAVAGGIIIAYRARPAALLDSATYTFARDVAYEIMNLYAVKMAAVFMISTSTLAIRTGFIPRVPWLCVRAVSAAERTLRRVDYNGFSPLGATGQHRYPHR
jgi:hypothetical protein